MLLSRCPERIVPVFVLVICMLVWWWRGQAGAGLGELRSPAVRNLTASLCCYGVLSWRCREGASTGTITPLTVESYMIITVMCVKWRGVEELWMSRGGTRPSLCAA